MKITLKEIIGQYLSSATQGSQEFLRLWNLAVFGLKIEFNLDVTGEMKTVVLNVNANKTVDLPCDYISYSKIGVINGNGEVQTFKRNDSLTTYNGLNPSNRVAGTPQGSPNFYSYNQLYPNLYGNYYFNGDYYNLFGADSGGTTLGEYKVDESKKLIYLNLYNTYSQIVLEYLSDGYSEDGCDHSVDVRAVQAVVAYIRWQNAIDQPKKFNQSQIRGFKTEYFNEKRKAKMRLNPFRLNEMIMAEINSIKLTSKA